MEIEIFNIIILLLIFILGTTVASFFNAQIYRIEKEIPLKKFFTDYSRCEKCSRKLSVTDLLPVIGYLLTKGKCKTCGYKIPSIYPISELTVGLLFVTMWLLRFTPIEWILFNFLIFLSLYDLQYMGVPKILMNLGLAISVIYVLIILFTGGLLGETGVYIAIGISLFVFAVNLVKKSFGIGDVLLYLALSPFFTWQQYLLGAWLSVVLGGLVGIVLLLKDRNWAKRYIPFIPFIMFGFLVSYPLLATASEYLAYIASLW